VAQGGSQKRSTSRALATFTWSIRMMSQPTRRRLRITRYQPPPEPLKRVLGMGADSLRYPARPLPASRPCRVIVSSRRRGWACQERMLCSVDVRAKLDETEARLTEKVAGTRRSGRASGPTTVKTHSVCVSFTIVGPFSASLAPRAEAHTSAAGVQPVLVGMRLAGPSAGCSGYSCPHSSRRCTGPVVVPTTTRVLAGVMATAAIRLPETKQESCTPCARFHIRTVPESSPETALAVRADRHSCHPIVVAGQGVQEFPGFQVPHPHLPVVAAGDGAAVLMCSQSAIRTGCSRHLPPAVAMPWHAPRARTA